MPVAEIKVGPVVFGGEALPVIAGPCVIESREHTLRMAVALKKILADLDLPFIFKTSFDKANRTAGTAYRGPGLEEGLRIIEDIRRSQDVPVLTDIHHPEQAAAAAEVADILQIPAFLCRQTDLLSAAAATGKPVNVKKGQFLAPGDMVNVVKKIEEAGNRQILITERGATFGYNNLVADMRALPIMRAAGYPVIFDGTHSAQLPGSEGGTTGGSRRYIPAVLRAAVAAGCDGIFLEVHDRPQQARSDAATQWPLDQLSELLGALKTIRAAAWPFVNTSYDD